MKAELKRSPFRIASIVIASISLVFCVLSFLYIDNLMLHILQQGTLCLFMLLLGLDSILYKRQKLLGYLLIGVSAVILLSVIFATFVGFKTGKL